ncbi:MAG: heparinase II/III domain-containing protein, partial [Flavobacteriales bacterium]
SFIFELIYVRWVVDPGNQKYNELEQKGFDLWNKSQDSDRWTLITKSNLGHSTLTVNNQLHVVDGKASILDFKSGDRPEVTFEMSPTFEGQLKAAQRTFVKEGNDILLIQDNIEVNEATQTITWQLITTAEVEVTSNGAVLNQSGKKLLLENMTQTISQIKVVDLDPPPLELDRRIEGLKRIEINIPTDLAVEGKINFKIKLKGS